MQRCTYLLSVGLLCLTATAAVTGAEKSYNALIDYGEPSLRTHVTSRYRQGRSPVGQNTMAPRGLNGYRTYSCPPLRAAISLIRKSCFLSNAWKFDRCIPV